MGNIKSLKIEIKMVDIAKLGLQRRRLRKGYLYFVWPYL